MSLLSRFRTQVLSWWHDIPLPALEADARPIFQSWNRFDTPSNRWAPLTSTFITASRSASTSAEPCPSEDVQLARDSRLVLVTWNIDATSPAPEARVSAIISHIQNLVPAADIIFLQEVSRPALSALLAIPWLREHWYSSEADTTKSGTQSFASVILLSMSRFGDVNCTVDKVTLGPVWRVKYPSRFDRDALCCDLLLPSSGLLLSQSPSTSTVASVAATSKSLSHKYLTRIRLINVHLDSLPIQPSLRPRQLSIVASYLRAASRGLVAGDFNSVLPEDDMLISANSLVDTWTELHPNEMGFTWGVNGKQPFPPNRLDKVAMFGLKGYEIDVIPSGTCTAMDVGGLEREQQVGALLLNQAQEQKKHDHNWPLEWSDHYGLVCSFALVGAELPSTK